MIRVENLSGRWGDFSLKNITLSLEPGEYRAIIGPCGAGKSLLLQCVAGLHPTHRGRIFVGDEEITRLLPERRTFGYVPQEPSVFPHMSVRANIAFGLRYHRVRGEEARERVEDAIDLLHLRPIADRTDPTSLSGGEAQKVVLARALAIHPRALLLDEPLGSLDYQSRIEVSEALTEISDELDITVLHITHDYHEAAKLADTVTVMRDGAVMQVGSVEDIFWRPANHFVAEFVGVDNIIPVRSSSNGTLEAEGLTLHASCPVPRGDLWATVRPRDIVLGEAAAAMANSFPATVRQVVDEGFVLRIVLQSPGPQLVASLPKRAALVPPRVGEEITVGFSAESVHCFAGEED